MLSKNDQRLRRSKQTRTRIALQRVARLTVHRTNLHIYAAVISDDGARILASASTAEADVRKDLAGDSKVSGKGGNVAAAAETLLPLPADLLSPASSLRRVASSVDALASTRVPSSEMTLA